jgi:hypothetical protein
MRRARIQRRIQVIRIAVVVAVLALPTVVLPSLAPAASVASLTLTGGAGTLTVAGTLYAKAGGAVGVDVATSGDTGCVRLFENGAPVGSQSNASGGSAWHFDLLAPDANGVQQLRATAYATADCHGAWGSATSSYIADSTGPRISALYSTAPNQYGWNNSNVTIREKANDGGMVGVDPASVGPILSRYTGETAGTPLVLGASDLLGNQSTTSLTVRIDKTPPSLSIDGVSAGADYTLGGVPAGGCHATDALSGVDSCDGHAPGGVGTRTYVATAIDRAGNVTQGQVTYHVSYGFRWAGTNPTSVAAGGTITFRVQLLEADATVVQAGSMPTIVGGTGTVTWNTTSHRYVITMKPTGGAGAHATVGVHLDDGTDHTFVLTLT